MESLRFLGHSATTQVFVISNRIQNLRFKHFGFYILDNLIFAMMVYGAADAKISELFYKGVQLPWVFNKNFFLIVGQTSFMQFSYKISEQIS